MQTDRSAAPGTSHKKGKTHHVNHIDAVTELFRKEFGGEPAWISRAPGRVNLIGEHTDYSGGFVFPAAIDRGIWVAAGPSEDGLCHLASESEGGAPPFSLADSSPSSRVSGWSQYPAGVAWVLGAKTPIKAAVLTTLPLGAGVSSSAAIELAFAILWNHIENLGHDNKELALLSVKAEREYVGMPCGTMDQLASALGVEGSALFIDTLDSSVQKKPLPAGLVMVVCDTGKRRALVDGEYKARREQVESASEKLRVPMLRHAGLGDWRNESLTELEAKRTRHVLTENQRCIDFAAALERGDEHEIGLLMAESHQSLRDDFEVSVPELDGMAEACSKAPGCVGVRLTGAGFGGCCVALVHAGQLEDFLQSAEKAYRSHYPQHTPRLLPCRAAKGAELLIPAL